MTGLISFNVAKVDGANPGSWEIVQKFTLFDDGNGTILKTSK